MAKTADANFEFQKIVAIVGTALMAIKFLAYFTTHSVSILTDALESIVNVVAAFIGLFALYISSRPADRSHPFGHGKIETVSSSVEGTLITVAGCMIILEAINRILHPGEIRELDIGLILIAITAIVNFAVGRSAISRGTKSRSPALVASGKHLCSDTVSSVGIIIGLAALYGIQALGYEISWLDAAIAGAFGCVIIYTGVKVIRGCLNDFMDAADTDLIAEVTEAINGDRHYHWIDVYGLRIIKYGPNMFINMSAVLPRMMPLRLVQGELSEVETTLRERYGDSAEVSINPVPCTDLSCRYCRYSCSERKERFVCELAWTPQTLCCINPHIDKKASIINIDATD
jgi:cation diffusion facilitator family transporter